jgi:hypothetical protein
LVTIRHQLGFDRAVSAKYNSLFKGLPSRLRPFGLQFSIIFAILLLLILVTCRSQFDFIFLVYRQPVVLSTLPKIPSFFLV